MEKIISKNKINEHENVLREKVFQVDTKWPHFRLLLTDIRALAQQLEKNTVVVALERTLLYGGYSLLAPFFHNQKYLSIDCSPESADLRGVYNDSMVADRRFIKIPYYCRTPIENTGLAAESADCVIIPNLIHHIKNQDQLFNEIARILKPSGLIYIFEPLIRELHQMPDDYLRYTPFGLTERLKTLGMNVTQTQLEGGPFSAVAYCWTQALQYFPSVKRHEMETWFYQNHFNQLMQWDEEYKENIQKNNSSFPVAFSIMAKK